MPTGEPAWGLTQHCSHRDGENLGSYDHHWATGWTSPESIYVLSLRPLSHVTANTSTITHTNVFWCFIPKPHHPRPPLVKLPSLVSCHFSVTNETTRIKAPSIVLRTQWALAKLSSCCCVSHLSFRTLPFFLSHPHHCFWNALCDKSQAPAVLWMAECFEAPLPRKLYNPKNTSEWVTFLIRLPPWLVMDTLNSSRDSNMAAGINTSTMASSVKSQVLIIQSQDVSHLSHHYQYQSSRCRCAERLINVEFWLL